MLINRWKERAALVGTLGTLGLMLVGLPYRCSAQEAKPATMSDSTPALTDAGYNSKDASLVTATKHSRKDFAVKFGEKLGKAGVDASTLAAGADGSTLYIQDPHCSHDKLPRIAKALPFDDLKSLGFKHIIYTNGFGDELSQRFEWSLVKGEWKK